MANQRGKGLMALPAMPPPAAPTGPASWPTGPPQAVPLWMAQQWTAEGDWAYGRVAKYQEQPRGAGWIDADDGGPEVYFNPRALSAELAELLRGGA